MATEEKRKRGRPRTYLDDRSALTVRMSKEVREKLKAAAWKSSWTLTQEVEERLRKSFLEEER